MSHQFLKDKRVSILAGSRTAYYVPRYLIQATGMSTLMIPYQFYPCTVLNLYFPTICSCIFKCPVRIHDYNKHIIHYLSAGPAIFSGTRALNRTQILKFRNNSLPTDHVALVTVFTTYNSTADSDSRRNDLVSVGNVSYNKVERSMAILNVFLNFVQVFLYHTFKATIIEMSLTHMTSRKLKY